jgi:predicted metal-binding protein
MLDKAIQQRYHRDAEGLILAYVSGSCAGALDHQRSEELKNVIVKNENEVDWFATYKLRQKVQEGYRKADELNRNRRSL